MAAIAGEAPPDRWDRASRWWRIRVRPDPADPLRVALEGGGRPVAAARAGSAEVLPNAFVAGAPPSQRSRSALGADPIWRCAARAAAASRIGGIALTPPARGATPATRGSRTTATFGPWRGARLPDHGRGLGEGKAAGRAAGPTPSASDRGSSRPFGRRRSRRRPAVPARGLGAGPLGGPRRDGAEPGPRDPARRRPAPAAERGASPAATRRAGPGRPRGRPRGPWARAARGPRVDGEVEGRERGPARATVGGRASAGGAGRKGTGPSSARGRSARRPRASVRRAGPTRSGAGCPSAGPPADMPGREPGGTARGRGGPGAARAGARAAERAVGRRGPVPAAGVSTEPGSDAVGDRPGPGQARLVTTVASLRRVTSGRRRVPSPGPSRGWMWPCSMRGSSVTSSLYQPV